jgi:mono/diheme cytochrome c family protein
VHARPAASLKLEMPARTQTVTLSELKHRVPTATLTVDDPVYKTRKTYEGFWLKDVLKSGGLGQEGGDEVVFHCADGYSPTMPWSRLEGHRALLAFREKGRKGGWQSFLQGKSRITPAPFYLVWDAQGDEYPWPYQLVGIEVVDFAKTYNRIYPSGQARDSAVFRGFTTFREKCLRCHSINLQGGTQCPELNYPKNITEYRDSKLLKQFIRNPSSFRARSKMPAFPDLKDQELDDILSYLKWMRDHKNPG